MSKLTVILDAELESALGAYGQKRKLTRSQAVRTVLRFGLGIIKDGADAGLREAFTAGQAKVLEAVSTALKKLAYDLDTEKGKGKVR